MLLSFFGERVAFAYHRRKGKKSTEEINVIQTTGRSKMMVIRVEYFIKSSREKPVNHLFDQGTRN